MPLRMEVGFGPGHMVLDGNPAPPTKKTQPPIFCPCLLWPNGRPSELLLNTCLTLTLYGVARFYSAPQCSHCKRCTSYDNSVRPSVCLSVCLSHAGIVKTTARSTVQFALLDSKMCLVL